MHTPPASMDRARLNVSLVSKMLLFVVGLGLGARGAVWLTTLGHRTTTPPAVAQAAPIPTYAPTAAYLVLGVTEADQSPQILESIWIVTAYGGHAAIELLAVPPTASLQDEFTIDPSKLSSALNPIAPTPLVGQVVVDRAGLAAITDQVGPVQLGGKQRTGQELLQFIDAADNEDDRLLRQAAAMQALIAHAAVRRYDLDLEQLAQHMSSGDPSVAALRNLVDPFIPIQMDKVRVRILTRPL